MGGTPLYFVVFRQEVLGIAAYNIHFAY